MERQVIWSAELTDLTALQACVEAVAARLPETGVVALHGPMGIGKTTWVNALCAAWGIEGQGASPTFGLVHHYPRPGRSEVAHWDLYRLQSEEEAWDAGVEDSFLQPKLNLVEWPERAPSLMPEDSWMLRMTWAGGARKVTLEAPVPTRP